MSALLRISRIFFLASVVLLLIGCGQQGSTPAPPPTPTPTPTPGPTQWAAQASPSNSSDGSWSFTFVVDSAVTSVSSLKAVFPAEFQCGDIVFDISTGGSFPGPWTMTNGQFTIQEDIDILGSLTIDGTIPPAAKEATGTWKVLNNSLGWSCDGAWTAQPA